MMMMKHKEITVLVKIVTNTNTLWKNSDFLKLQSSVNIVTNGVYRLNAKMIKRPWHSCKVVDMAVTWVDIAQRTRLSAAHHCALFVASLFNAAIGNTFHLVSTSRKIQWTMNSKGLEGRCGSLTRSITGPSTCGLKKKLEGKKKQVWSPPHTGTFAPFK